MEKGGFLAVEWVVSIILILVGLGILIFAVTNLFTQNDVDKNTCHFSLFLHIVILIMEICLKLE